MLYQALCISTKNQQGERYKAFVCHEGMAIVIPCYAREEDPVPGFPVVLLNYAKKNSTTGKPDAVTAPATALHPGDRQL